MKHRVYYAITFDQEIREKLCAYQQQLIRQARQIKPTPATSLHMTLAFIGEIEETELPLLKAIIREIAFEPFHFKISYLGTFNDRKDSFLYYLGTTDDQALYQLQRQLTDQLKKHQIPFHDKQYLPHITLSRKTILNRPLPDPQSLTVNVTSFHLLESIPYENTRIGKIIDD